MCVLQPDPKWGNSILMRIRIRNTGSDKYFICSKLTIFLMIRLPGFASWQQACLLLLPGSAMPFIWKHVVGLIFSWTTLSQDVIFSSLSARNKQWSFTLWHSCSQLCFREELIDKLPLKVYDVIRSNMFRKFMLLTGGGRLRALARIFEQD